MLELINVFKNYKGKKTYTQVLKNISLNVDEGDFIILTGKSGSGKSTLLNLIGTIDDFDSGEYIFNGKNINEMSMSEKADFRYKNIGFVFQNNNLIREINVKDNVEMPLGYRNISKKIRNEKSLEVLEKVGLKDKILSYPDELSGGEQQRVSIARALITKPKILLLDEPTGSLDQKTGDLILDILSDLNKEGMTILLVTHDREIIKRGTRNLVIVDGRLEDVGI